jgi:hypothetical protein
LWKKVFKRTFPLLIPVCLMVSCNYEPDSYGDFEKIYVFADSTLYNDVRVDLEQVFDNYVYTPSAEKSFYLELHPISDLSMYERRRNLIFLAILGQDDPVSAYIDKALTPDVTEAVREGRLFEIFQENLYARDQMVIILPAINAEILKKNILDNRDAIYKRLEDYYFKRLNKIMFLQGEQTLLEEYLRDNLGWRIRVQHDYIIVKETDDKNFIWFRRFDPTRNLSVYRFRADTLPTGDQWLIHLRDSLAAVYFESDQVDRADTYIVRTTFNGMPAIVMIGVWQNHDLLIGGPLKTIAFFDPESRYVYLIDLMVTAPGKRKKPFMDQLEVMARTFRFSS